VALTISQIVASSYNAVEAEAKKPANQWEESAFLKELKRQGAIKSIPGGPQIEAPLDYRRNPGTEFQAFDLDPLVMGKTEVLTAAVYDPAQLSVPVVWSKADETKNPSENQKVNFVKHLLTNAFASHEDIIEQYIFGTTNEGFLGLQTQLPDSGQGTVGGIASATETWWRHHSGTYAAAGTDMVAKMTLAWNTAAKGSGGSSPTLLVSDGETQATFEGTQVGQQRYVDSQDLKAAFKTLAFKNARYVFSQHGGTRLYMLNPKAFKLEYYEGAMRQKGDTQEIDDGQGYRFFLFSMLQTIVTAKSRHALLTEA
jgi:hypothetical protein